MSTVSSCFLPRIALVLSTAALVPSGSAGAQQALVATARMSSRAIPAGADSGKFFVSLKISGIPEVGLRYLRRDQIVLVDASGRVYSPIGYAIGGGGTEKKDLLAAYLTPPAERLGERQYVFLVATGLSTFELRVAGLEPVPVVATVTGR